MCSEPPTDLLDLFFSHMLRMSNVQLHPETHAQKRPLANWHQMCLEQLTRKILVSLLELLFELAY